MKVRITDLIWVIFVILSILMGGSIGRSYMWVIAGGIVIFLLVTKGKNGVPSNSLLSKYTYFIIYCIIVTAICYVASGFKSNEYIKSQLIELLILAFAASYLAAYYSKIDSIIKYVKNFSWILLVAGILEEITKFNITVFFRNERYVSQYLINEGRIISVFSHPIGYAIVLTFFFLLALYFPYKKRNKQITYVCLILINLLCTKTRMAMIAAAISALIFWVKSGKLKSLFKGKMRYNRNSVIYGIALSLVGIICVVIFHNTLAVFWNTIIYRILQMFTGSEQGIRLGVIANYFSGLSKNSVLEILFGRGTGYSSYYMLDNPIYYWNSMGEKMAWDETTDNMYISILMNYGIVGCILFLSVFVTAINRIIHEKNEYILFGCSGIVALWIDLFFFEGLYWPTVIVVLGVYMAFITKSKKL